MSDRTTSLLPLAGLVPLVMTVCLLAGCSSVTGFLNRVFEPARADAPAERPAYSPWVPMGSPGIHYPAPVWPTGPYTGGGQADGMATLIQEMDHLSRLVDTVSRLPADPGEYRINFVRIQADLAAVRAGLVEALMQPHAAPREYPPIHRDYLE